MDFTLKIMGTASAMPVIGRNQSAQVLSVHGRLFLIDCGEGVQKQLIANHVSIQKIDTICISHIHGDHVFGIFGLLSTMGLLGRTIPLYIYAPQSFGPILKFFLSYYGEGLNYEIKYTALDMKEPEAVFHTNAVDIFAFPLNHKIETFGFLFREKTPQRNVHKHLVMRYELSLTEIGTLKRGEDIIRDGKVLSCDELTYMPYKPRSFAYVSDTAPFAELAGWVKGVDILYHEATYLKDNADLAEKRHHSTTHQAAQCALEAGVGKLVVAHYSSRERDTDKYLKECREIFPESYAASDRDVFDIPLDKVVD